MLIIVGSFGEALYDSKPYVEILKLSPGLYNFSDILLEPIHTAQLDYPFPSLPPPNQQSRGPVQKFVVNKGLSVRIEVNHCQAQAIKAKTQHITKALSRRGILQSQSQIMTIFSDANAQALAENMPLIEEKLLQMLEQLNIAVSSIKYIEPPLQQEQKKSKNSGYIDSAMQKVYSDIFKPVCWIVWYFNIY